METLILHPADNNQVEAIKAIARALKVPFEVKSEEEKSLYNSEFNEKMKLSDAEKKAGHYKVISIEELWK